MESPAEPSPPAASPSPGEPSTVAPPPVARPNRRPSRLAAAVVAAAVALGGVGGYAITRGMQSGTASSATSSTASASSPTAVTTPASGTTGTSTTRKLTLAEIEAAVDPTLVDITAQVGDATAAGTGMVISSTGEILTNNHVISGATDITVQIGGTGKSYSAEVVGYDVTEDVAVLQIANVSGLATIATGSASTVSTSDAIVAIGNALGQGGTPAAVEGVVAALEQTITASDDYGTSAETLHGLIEFEADVQPGDSGGSLVNAYGQVVGMTTAASSGVRSMSTASTTAFAIPIDRALAIARQIKAGTESATVHIGEHGLLGVAVDGSASSVVVVGVQSGSAAAQAGVVTGSVITAVDGKSVDSSAALSSALASTHVGDEITVSWQDAAGAAHTSTLKLTTGAA